MKITVQSIRFNADKKLLDFIQKKANKLDQYYDHIINGEVYLKLENVEDEANKITEIKLMLPGMQVFAKEQCKTFEEATDLAVEGLRKQIDKYKQKKAVAAEAAKKAVLTTTEEEYE
jgi:putative sigma-54 modulation protein